MSRRSRWRSREALDGGPAVWPVAAERTSARGSPPGSSTTASRSSSRRAGRRMPRSACCSRRRRCSPSAAATHDALGDPGQWLLALPAHYIAGAQVLVRGHRRRHRADRARGRALRPGRVRRGIRSARSANAALHLARAGAARAARRRRRARSVQSPAALHAFDRILVGGQAARAGARRSGGRHARRARHAHLRVERDGRRMRLRRACARRRRACASSTGCVELSRSDARRRLPRRPRAHRRRLHDRRRGTRWYRTGDLGELAARRTAAHPRPGRRRDHLGRRQGRARRGRAGGACGPGLRRGRRRCARPTPSGASARPSSHRARMPPRHPTALATLAAATDAAGLTPAARPVRLELVVDRMPLLASGKPDRRALEELVRAAATGVADQAHRRRAALAACLGIGVRLRVGLGEPAGLLEVRLHLGAARAGAGSRARRSRSRRPRPRPTPAGRRPGARGSSRRRRR